MHIYAPHPKQKLRSPNEGARAAHWAAAGTNNCLFCRAYVHYVLSGYGAISQQGYIIYCAQQTAAISGAWCFCVVFAPPRRSHLIACIYTHTYKRPIHALFKHDLLWPEVDNAALIYAGARPIFILRSPRYHHIMELNNTPGSSQ